MRIKFHKEAEYLFKKYFISEKYLLKKRLIRAYKNNYEEELYYISNLNDKELDSVDIGVYRGVYSYQLSKLSKHVHAFEPNPLIFPFLKRNLTKIIKNLTLYNYALSDEEGITNLKIPIRKQTLSKKNYEELFQLGAATIHDKNISQNKTKSYKVEKTRLDDILKINKIGFMKIDVEGHEKKVINGSLNLIKLNKPNLLVEIEERHTKEKVENTIAYINSLGYKSFYLENKKLLSTSKLLNFKNKNNYFFLK